MDERVFDDELMRRVHQRQRKKKKMPKWKRMLRKYWPPIRLGLLCLLLVLVIVGVARCASGDRGETLATEPVTTAPTEETTEPPTTEPPTEAPTAAPTAEPTEEPQAQKYTYVLNTNPSSMKFHYPSCRSVDKMKESNKLIFEGTREEVIAKGYSPCGNCHP